jgi:hypothetical protein
LTLCAILLLPVRGRIFYELGLSRLAGPSLPFQLGGALLRPFAEWAYHNSMPTVIVINLPAAIFELPLMFKEDWAAPTWYRQSLRAISWPILGSIFWWVAGRGADALVAARRRLLLPSIGWVETVVGSLIAASGATTVIGVEFFSGADRGDLQLLAAVAGMWTVLGGATIAARIAQWRVRRSLRNLTANSPPPDVTATPEAR